MNCLCCGKPLPEKNEQIGWHNRCINRFFGTSALPNVEIDEKVRTAIKLTVDPK